MDDIFTQDNDDSYREIALSNGFQLKMNPKMIMDKPCNNIYNKKLNEVIEDQLDDLNEHEYTKTDYIQMALHYKSLCKSYKKQLVESHKTIRELHFTIEQLERKNWTQKYRYYIFK